jgi:hypothetical protein
MRTALDTNTRCSLWPSNGEGIQENTRHLMMYVSVLTKHDTCLGQQLGCHLQHVVGLGCLLSTFEPVLDVHASTRPWAYVHTWSVFNLMIHDHSLSIERLVQNIHG